MMATREQSPQAVKNVDMDIPISEINCCLADHLLNESKTMEPIKWRLVATELMT